MINLHQKSRRDFIRNALGFGFGFPLIGIGSGELKTVKNIPHRRKRSFYQRTIYAHFKNDILKRELEEYAMRLDCQIWWHRNGCGTDIFGIPYFTAVLDFKTLRLKDWKEFLEIQDYIHHEYKDEKLMSEDNYDDWKDSLPDPMYFILNYSKKFRLPYQLRFAIVNVSNSLLIKKLIWDIEWEQQYISSIDVYKDVPS